jgi:bacteriocin leader peptide (microcyclamide/patellamide family)
MDFNLMPQVAQPVNRITTGQLPAELAELSEEALSQLGEDASNSASVLASLDGRDWFPCVGLCSYDGDDAE